MPFNKIKSFAQYLSALEPGTLETVSRVLQVMRESLPGTVEQVRHGIAIFRCGDRDIAGIAARKGFYSIYVPHDDVMTKHSHRLGNVDASKSCIRFKRLEDVNEQEFRRMLAHLRTKMETGG